MASLRSRAAYNRNDCLEKQERPVITTMRDPEKNQTNDRVGIDHSAPDACSKRKPF